MHVSQRTNLRHTQCTHCGHVNGGRCFIHNEDAALANKGSCQAKQLSLSHAKILPTFRDNCI